MDLKATEERIRYLKKLIAAWPEWKRAVRYSLAADEDGESPEK